MLRRRPLAAFAILVALIVGSIGVAVATNTSADLEVRIAARGTERGSVEFALQQRLPDGSWSERLFGRQRFMTPELIAQRTWKYASPVTVSVPLPEDAPLTPTAAPPTSDDLTILNAPPGVHYKEEGVIIVAGVGDSDSPLFRLRAGLWLAGSVGRDPDLAAGDPEDWCALWIEDVHGNLEQLRTLDAIGQTTKWFSIGGTGTVQVFVDPLCGSARWAVGFIPADDAARGE